MLHAIQNQLSSLTYTIISDFNKATLVTVSPTFPMFFSYHPRIEYIVPTKISSGLAWADGLIHCNMFFHQITSTKYFADEQKNKGKYMCGENVVRIQLQIIWNIE